VGYLADPVRARLGKTAVGSHWLVHQAVANPRTEWAVFAPTFRDVRKICIEGSTGILAALQPDELKPNGYLRNELKISLTNGSVIYGYTAEQPDRARGANLWGAWADELSSWEYESTWHEGLIPALRKGRHPRAVVTTTPKPTSLVRNLVARTDGSVHLTRGSTWENRDNLSSTALAELEHRYGGTRVGRQELEGELLDETEGALWRYADIDNTRIKHNEVPPLLRIVVAMDPAVTSGEDSDETGIIVAGESRDAHGYILADYSMRGTPHECMKRVVRAYKEHQANMVIGEINNGGDYIGTLLRTVDPLVPYRTVHASRGKLTRAEPVASLYEQHRMHHVGSFPELEDQMCTWTVDADFSPDHLDAMVWAVSDLRGLFTGAWSKAYGVVNCVCGHIYMSELHKKCPKCGHDVI
jgi:predicted phage terminase large subunit-like protein